MQVNRPLLAFRWLGSLLRTHAPDTAFLSVLTLIVVVLAVANRLGPNQWLMWWDNINPELNLSLNIKRALVAVWQEYQGLGLVGGMGHASDLPRLLVLWLLTAAGVPLRWLRFTWVFVMLWMGLTGTYVFARSWLLPRAFSGSPAGIRRLGAFVGSVFLLTNLATLQMFRTPFEPFITHFGFLPWLVYSFLLVTERPTRRRVLGFAALTLFSATQAYVQTVFFVYLAGLLILSFGRRLKHLAAAWGIILAINAFWLLPTAYFTLTHAGVTTRAKINQMATDEVFLRNRAFGTIWDTIQLKGFWFDTFDLDPQKRQMVPVLGLWREYAEHPLISGILSGLFVVVFVGALVLLAKKRRPLWWLVAWLLFAVVMLTLDTQPFTWINEQLSRVPLLHQAYRFRFTKVSLFAGFTYSLLFAVGMTWVLTRLSRPRFLGMAIVAGYLVIAGIIAGPMLEGKLLHESAKLTVPAEYFDLFSFFNQQPKQARIANLPQPTYWGWQYSSWGYTGWGFLWYGIQQPILDRAFDPWSGYNENYYWEISRSIYSKDPQSLLAVLTKYDVRYLLLDEHIISPSHNRALFTEEIKEMLAGLQEIREVARFGKLTVYETKAQPNFRIAENLPVVSPAYGWTDNDLAYAQLGDYITEIASSPSAPRNDMWTYPFRSLFTKRSVGEREFTITETDDTIVIGSLVEATSASILKSDAIMYDSTKSADLVPEAVKPCGLLHDGNMQATRTPDGALRFASRGERGCLSFGLTNQRGPETGLPHRDGYLVAVKNRHITGRLLQFALINQTAKHTELETYLPITHNQQPTTYFILPPLSPDGLGYSVYITNDAIGRQETINDLGRIRVYRIPYNDMVKLRELRSLVASPNNEVTNNEATLILSQAFDPGWTAWERIPSFPYFQKLNDHVLVNNWANGWKLNNATIQQFNNSTIIVFFLPQLLEWLGFLLLPLPFLSAFWKRRET